MAGQRKATTLTCTRASPDMTRHASVNATLYVNCELVLFHRGYDEVINLAMQRNVHVGL